METDKGTKDVIDEGAQTKTPQSKARKAAASTERKPVGKRTATKRISEAIEAAQSGRLSLDSAVDTELYVRAAIENKPLLDLLVASLKSDSRRDRQMASLVVSGIAKVDANLLADGVPALVAALSYPEAQTRWQALEALHCLIPVDLPACKKAFNKAEDCLYDEASGTVRATAFHFLCELGAQDSRTSKKVWPCIEEAIQCYHGDLEFQDMLNDLLRFSAGNIHKDVKVELAQRMRFDADNGHGIVKRKAMAIVENCESN